MMNFKKQQCQNIIALSHIFLMLLVEFKNSAYLSGTVGSESGTSSSVSVMAACEGGT